MSCHFQRVCAWGFYKYNLLSLIFCILCALTSTHSRCLVCSMKRTLHWLKYLSWQSTAHAHGVIDCEYYDGVHSSLSLLLPMFDPQHCNLCGLSSVLRQYPHCPDFCVTCSHLICKKKNNAVLKVLTSGFDNSCSNHSDLLATMFHKVKISIDAVSCKVISAFLLPSLWQIHFEHSRAAKYLFLKKALLANGSIFCKFTYFHNRTSGNISQCEDILDRIISFLEHKREYAIVRVNGT